MAVAAGGPDSAMNNRGGGQSSPAPTGTSAYFGRSNDGGVAVELMTYGHMPKLIGVNRGCKPYARTLLFLITPYYFTVFPMISY